MRRLRQCVCWSLAVPMYIGIPVRAFEDRIDPEAVATVTVTGEALSEDAARRDALRKALERGGRNEISSRSHVENFTLIRDTIYAKADGIVTDYQVLEQGNAVGGTQYCKIRAEVSKSAVASTWGEVQNVLDQTGRPGIAVCIL